MSDTPQAPDATPEQQLAALQQRYDEANAALAEARRQVEATERSRRIDQMLIEQEATDLEAARLLTEAAVARMDAPDLALAIADLRKHRPYLFRAPRSTAPTGGTQPLTGAMAPAPRSAANDNAADLDTAAEAAAATGDRRDLLRYLRLRRR